MPEGRDQGVWEIASLLVDKPQSNNQESNAQIQQVILVVPGSRKRNGNYLSFLCLGEMEQLDHGFPPGDAKVLKSSNLHCCCLAQSICEAVYRFLLLLPSHRWSSDGYWIKGEHKNGFSQTAALVPLFRLLGIQVSSFPTKSSQDNRNKDFPDGPIAKTPHSHCRRPSGN